MEQPSNQIPDPAGLLKTFAATTAVLIAGLVLLWFATGGAQAFTTETLRRQQVASQPQRIEAFDLTLASGEKTSLNAVLAPGHKVWLVDFVYTRCQTVCSSLGSIYQQLQAQIEARGLQGKVGLLSISFDPANDTASALASYSARMQMNPGIWQIVTLTDWQDRRRLLDAFGIMVVPAPLGEFEHNAALHVVSSDGTLYQIIDYTDFNNALNVAAGMAQDVVPGGASVAAIAP